MTSYSVFSKWSKLNSEILLIDLLDLRSLLLTNIPTGLSLVLDKNPNGVEIRIVNAWINTKVPHL